MRFSSASGFGRFFPGMGRSLAAFLFLLGATPLLPAQGYPLWDLNGAAASDYFGSSVAGVGDVNGDGHDDLVVGAPYASVGGSLYVGRARVVSGADGSALFTLQGSMAYERFGWAVAGVGDVSGDGVPDVVVSSPFAVVAGFSNAGQVRIFSGADASGIGTFSGTGNGENFGYALGLVGDVDDTGTTEIVVGTPGATVNGAYTAGQAKVLSLPSGTVVHTLDGVAAADSFGRAVASAGDVDADGFPDVLVGAPGTAQSKFTPAGPGYAKVFSGATGSLLQAIPGGAAENFGNAVAGLGDVNGDGHSDYAVQAPNGAFGGNANAGIVRVYSGASGTLLYSIGGSAAFEGFGRALASAGDVNGDGTADLLVGSSNANGYAGVARVFSGGTGQTLFSFSGATPNPAFGGAVGAAGDVNDDGFPDLVVGAPSATIGGLSNAGLAKVISPIGIPPTANPYGTGCAGTAGFAATTQTCGGAPTLGNAGFALSISKGVGGTFALLFFGTSPDPAGSPLFGCPAYLAGSVSAAMPPIVLAGSSGVGGEGYGLRGVSVPVDPALSGGTAHFQWQVLDLGSPNGFFTTSNALSVTVP